MKKLFLLSALVGLFALSSCESDDGLPHCYEITEEVTVWGIAVDVDAVYTVKKTLSEVKEYCEDNTFEIMGNGTETSYEQVADSACE